MKRTSIVAALALAAIASPAFADDHHGGGDGGITVTTEASGLTGLEVQSMSGALAGPGGGLAISGDFNQMNASTSAQAWGGEDSSGGVSYSSLNSLNVDGAFTEGNALAEAQTLNFGEAFSGFEASFTQNNGND